MRMVAAQARASSVGGGCRPATRTSTARSPDLDQPRRLRSARDERRRRCHDRGRRPHHQCRGSALTGRAMTRPVINFSSSPSGHCSPAILSMANALTAAVGAFGCWCSAKAKSLRPVGRLKLHHGGRKFFGTKKACCLYPWKVGGDRYLFRRKPPPFDFVRPKVEDHLHAQSLIAPPSAGGSRNAIATGTKRDRTTRTYEAGYEYAASR
jgi:hypothetical protein